MGLSNYIPNSRLAQPGVCTSTTRPATPFEGMVIYETDTNRVLVWNGSAWKYMWFSTIPSFYAHRTSQVTLSGSTNTLVFNSASVNNGGHYNTSNGRFTAPVDGFYFMTTTVLTQLDQNGCDIRFQKNGVEQSAYAGFSMTAGTNNTHRQASISGVIYLAANDYVTVNPFSTSTVYAYGDTHGHTNFSGYWVGG